MKPALDRWLLLLEQHIHAGTGKRAHFSSLHVPEWSVEELISTISEKLPRNVELSRNTLSSWRVGATFPTNHHLAALFNAFWPSGPRGGSEFEELSKALSAAKAERIAERRKSRFDSQSSIAPSGRPRRPPTNSPFPGLRAFGEKDAALFFGRTREIRDALSQFARTNLLWVTGPSGNGKSSLVAAGLLPKLKEGEINESEAWDYITFTPGVAPMRRLYAALLDRFPLLLPGRRLHQLLGSEEEFCRMAISVPGHIASLINQICIPQQDKHPCLLIFIDQFEECFTLSERGEASQLFKIVLASLEYDNLRVIATIRHEFLCQAIEVPDLGATLSGNSFFSLPIPRRDALREMIEQPAATIGLNLESGLTDRILDDTGDAPGALALMAYTLDELYKNSRGNELRLRDYIALDGVSGAISARAEGVFQQLGMMATTFQDLFGCLIEVNEAGVATRRRMSSRDVASEMVQEGLSAFTAARLLTSSEDLETHFPIWEVAHEAVFQEWPRLRDWIGETWDLYRIIGRMEREARAWNSRGRPDHLLPNQEAINEFQEAEARLFQHRRHDEVFKAFTVNEQDRLLTRLRGGGCDHETRREIGDRLATVGDTRSGVGLYQGLPDIDWIGCTASSTMIEGRTFYCNNFWIARFPVTTEQFSAFIAAEDAKFSLSEIPDIKMTPQASPIAKERNRVSNTPRDSVSWYQARAFAQWLNGRFAGTTLHLSDGAFLALGQELEIRLPTEAEWQIAAEAEMPGRPYPWGIWDPGRANTIEAALGRTVAVGMYPEGASGYGVEDLSGNVVEWCLTNHDLDNADINANVSKTLKGGSFYHSPTHATISYRRHMLPSNAFSNFGFRLVIARHSDLLAVRKAR